MELISNEDKAAALIQNVFKRYLLKKKIKENQHARRTLDENENLVNENKIWTNPVVFSSGKHIRFKEEVNSFYVKFRDYSLKKDSLRMVHQEIDCILRNLQQIRKLGDWRKLETTCMPNEVDVKEAKRRHEYHLKQMNLEWWENLNVYETDAFRK